MALVGGVDTGGDDEVLPCGVTAWRVVAAGRAVEERQRRFGRDVVNVGCGRRFRSPASAVEAAWVVGVVSLDDEAEVGSTIFWVLRVAAIQDPSVRTWIADLLA